MTDPLVVESDDKIWKFLIDSLSAGGASVLFEKKDGTMREMVCTTRKDLITYVFPEGREQSEVQPKDDFVTVWDLESKGWRRLTRGMIDTVDQMEDSELPTE